MSRTLSVGQEHELLQKLEAAGLNGEAAQQVIDSPQNTLAKAMVALIRKEQACDDHFLVTVDYSQSFEQMIKAGRYDWVNLDIKSKHFPMKGKGTVELEITLVHYHRVMTTDDVLKDLDARGLRPIKIEELLALGASQPDLQRAFPIVALGSVWRRLFDDRRCPGLRGDGSERRHLNHYWVDCDWRADCRFGAVRK